MFTRITTVKKNGKTHNYLKLIENYWDKGKTKQRVIANFGNVEKLNVKRIDSAIASLIKFSSRNFVDISNLKSMGCQHLGEILAADEEWDCSFSCGSEHLFIPKYVPGLLDIFHHATMHIVGKTSLYKVSTGRFYHIWYLDLRWTSPVAILAHRACIESPGYRFIKLNLTLEDSVGEK